MKNPTTSIRFEKVIETIELVPHSAIVFNTPTEKMTYAEKKTDIAFLLTSPSLNWGFIGHRRSQR